MELLLPNEIYEAVGKQIVFVRRLAFISPFIPLFRYSFISSAPLSFLVSRFDLILGADFELSASLFELFQSKAACSVS